MAIQRVALLGSERSLPANASQVGIPNPHDFIDVTVMVRRRAKLPHHHQSKPISREEFAAKYGADPADIKQVEAFARMFDLTIMETDLARRSVRLGGTVAHVSEAFATQLQMFQSPEGRFRGRTGVLYIPATLENVVEGVFGLDERPQARARFRRQSFSGPLAGPLARHHANTSYTPNQVSALYDYPAGDGTGQTIGIVELGGGFSSSDLTTYFNNLGFANTPSVTSVSVDGAANSPVGDPNSADGEVLLDIEVIGSIVPGANIVVYFAPNTDQGFLDAITTAIHDTANNPAVISISWGGAESTWTSQALTSYDQAFQDAGMLGVTICIAAGDGGSSDGVTDGMAHVDFPASSPNVLACGGTRLESSKGAITSEVVWNDGSTGGATGGGVSEVFPLPSYQANAGVPPSVNASSFAGRGVPDVSGDADPNTGYQILVDGTSGVFGGTSAVAPLWSALIALINASTGKAAGFVNPALYSEAAGTAGFHDITSGNNGDYQAGPGWDACTGLGSPDGEQLLQVLTSSTSATA
jgi:kumamolisin